MEAAVSALRRAAARARVRGAALLKFSGTVEASWASAGPGSHHSQAKCAAGGAAAAAARTHHRAFSSFANRSTGNSRASRQLSRAHHPLFESSSSSSLIGIGGLSSQAMRAARERAGLSSLEKGIKEWSNKLVRARLMMDVSPQFMQRASLALLPAMATVFLVSHDRFSRSRRPCSSQAIMEKGEDGIIVASSSSSRHGVMLRQLQEELSLCLRLLYLIGVFTPAMLLWPLCLGLGVFRSEWMNLLCWTLENAGPAFIKWGQWAATRPDMFPADMCRTLERLYSNAPCHSIQWSQSAVQEAFGSGVFQNFEEEPIASGSIAQIHRAELTESAAAEAGIAPGTAVAVKIRHPGVEEAMSSDFKIMMWLAGTLTRLPGLQELRLEESVAQFGAPLREQLDLGREAENLARFNHNFRRKRGVSFPRPLFPLVAPGVLVETFEEGDLISRLVSRPDGRDSVAVAVMGMESYLQMLLRDNFVHADLHPGNILVKSAKTNEDCESLRQHREPRKILRTLASLVRGKVLGGRGCNQRPEIVILDVGMVAELSALDKQALTEFFTALTSLNGTSVAESIIRFSNEPPSPAKAKEFVAAMEGVFGDLDEAKMRVHTQEVIAQMLEAIRQNGISLRGAVSTVVVTTMILEGWSTKLHPDIRILDSIREMLPGKWSDRVSRAVDNIMGSGWMIVDTM